MRRGDAFSGIPGVFFRKIEAKLRIGEVRKGKGSRGQFYGGGAFISLNIFNGIKMFVKEEDLQNERKVLLALAGKIPLLRGFHLRRNRDAAGLYDYNGYYENEHKACVEVKTYETKPDAFTTGILSVEKIDHFREHTGVLHFVFYYFKNYNTVKVVNLALSEIEKRNINFTHRRSGEDLDQIVYFVSHRYATIYTI